MLIVTINEIPGKKLEALGVVRGSTVQSRNFGHDLMAGFRTLVGGEVTDYADMLTEARQIAMYLAKQHTKAPLTTIGSAIGGRNHATVLHSCKAVSNLIETDKAFRRQVEEIEKKVLAQ